MESFHQKIIRLTREGHIRVSEHGYDELADDKLSAREIVAGLATSELLEDYASFAKGHCALFLQHDAQGNPVHVV